MCEHHQSRENKQLSHDQPHKISCTKEMENLSMICMIGSMEDNKQDKNGSSVVRMFERSGEYREKEQKDRY